MKRFFVIAAMLLAAVTSRAQSEEVNRILDITFRIFTCPLHPSHFAVFCADLHMLNRSTCTTIFVIYQIFIHIFPFMLIYSIY